MRGYANIPPSSPSQWEDTICVVRSMLETANLLSTDSGEGCDIAARLSLLAQCKIKALSESFGHDSTTSAAATSYTPYGDGKTIAFRIRLARENLNMSEDDLAEKLDIHPGDVLAWEDSSDQPLAGMIIPLANALKCDPMWLLTGEAANSQGLSGKQQQPAYQRVDALSREVPQR